MGFLRKTGVIVVSVILFIVLLLGGILASLTLSLNYEKVQPKMHSLVEEVIDIEVGEEKIRQEILPASLLLCQMRDEISQNFEGYVVLLPCSVVREGYDSVMDYVLDYLVYDLYYKEYSCKFTECFENSEIPLFLVSDYAHKFWKSLFLKSLILSLFLFGLIILLIKNKFNFLVLLGSLIVPVSLIILALNRIGMFVARIILSPIYSVLSDGHSNVLISQIVAIFFSESLRVFLWMFISGLVFIVLGIALKTVYSKFYQENSQDKKEEKLSSEKKISKTEIKKIVKEEISKKKKK